MADAKSKKQASSGGVRALVEPRVCLHDAPTSIKVTGLQPNTPVTLTLNTSNDASLKFHSYAHYLSDDNGTVDVERSEAVGGAYTGVFPAGLFSSLKEFPDTHTRLKKDDPTTPWMMTLAVHKDHLTLEKSVVSEGLTTVMLERYIMAPGVRREPVVHERVRGSMFLPAGPGPYPAVIDILGGIGGLNEDRASMLASKGFACLAIAYFKYDDLPKFIKTLDLEYFEEAVEYILQQPGVIPDRCGVLCSSRGGSLGLAMGIYLQKVTAVVSLGGRLIGDITLTFRGQELWKGVEVNNSHYHIDEQNILTLNEDAMKKIIVHDHPSMPPCENAPDDTYFLFVAGDDDAIYTNIYITALTHRMKLHGRQSHCRSVIYPGLGHIIEPPYNTYAIESTYQVGPITVMSKWGGGAWGTCKAQEDNWQNMRRFLEIHVRDRSDWFQQFMGRTRGDNKCESLQH